MDDIYSEAIKEAYSSAPSDVVILHTLEIRHPSFLDDSGNLMAIRVVKDNQNLNARLEDSAKLNAGEMVEFIAMGFDLELPSIDNSPVPEVTIILDNVTRELMEYLDIASNSHDKIEVTYRPYLSDDVEAPQMDPPLTLILTEVSADIFRVRGKARMLDIGNKSFPNRYYKAKSFPGLVG